ncbi:MAG: transposase [Thermoplasmatales archaeon]
MRSKHSVDEKFEIVIEALTENTTHSDMSRRHGIFPTQLAKWKKQQISKDSYLKYENLKEFYEWVLKTISGIRDLVVSSAVEIADEMLRMNDKTRSAIANGVDGEGKRFYFISPPMPNWYALSEEEHNQVMMHEYMEY